ncbi:MAG: DNA repair protein RadA [Candidatus Gracilibacteria bacterium]
MAKASVNQFICTNCQNISSKWQGQCVSCGEWNTYVEMDEAPGALAGSLQKRKEFSAGRAIAVESVATILESGTEQGTNSKYRFTTGVEELDRVFGGGIVKGSMSLLAGEPGIGKSTLTLRLCKALADHGEKVLYISGEESVAQIADRARRMEVGQDKVFLANMNSIEDALATAQREDPAFVVIDSVQVMYAESLGGASGSISQIRFVTELLLEFAKTRNITVLLIGHVTKEGNLAGPKALEHLVDTVLLLEGERSHSFRILRAVKNRFGSTDEVGVFSMTEKGLEEVKNPSSVFLEGRMKEVAGSVITSTVEGTRAFLLEVQALTTYTKFGYPKRAAVGFDLNRLQLLLAVVGKYTNINLDSYDVYINVAGGLRIRESGLDVAIILAIISSKLQKPLPEGIIAFGEVGLTGEVRTLSFLEKRIKEAHKLGMKTFIVPASAALPKMKDVDIRPIKHVSELLKFFQ